MSSSNCCSEITFSTNKGKGAEHRGAHRCILRPVVICAEHCMAPRLLHASGPPWGRSDTVNIKVMHEDGRSELFLT